MQHRFVEFIPKELEEGVLYVSMQYKTAVHKCVCGCGNRVVTPITPKDWKLTFDGKSISLYPSIGNWNFACMSHYWITNNQIRYASSWNEYQAEIKKEGKEKKKRKLFSFKIKKRK